MGYLPALNFKEVDKRDFGFCCGDLREESPSLVTAEKMKIKVKMTNIAIFLLLDWVTGLPRLSTLTTTLARHKVRDPGYSPSSRTTGKVYMARELGKSEQDLRKIDRLELTAPAYCVPPPPPSSEYYEGQQKLGQ
ncbi:hypothetical protein Syun_009418 [Stephania yunnanensis]|uniref:Uncharacterized protein n=1 Tax=Stephania yunnanensis TaxID=152371 RepID=A0AAP0KGL4_9MAGN